MYGSLSRPSVELIECNDTVINSGLALQPFNEASLRRSSIQRETQTPVHFVVGFRNRGVIATLLSAGRGKGISINLN